MQVMTLQHLGIIVEFKVTITDVLILSLHSLTLANVVTIFSLPKYGLLLSAISHHP